VNQLQLSIRALHLLRILGDLIVNRFNLQSQAEIIGVFLISLEPFLRSSRFLFQTPARAVIALTSARVSTDSKIVFCTILDSLVDAKFQLFSVHFATVVKNSGRERAVTGNQCG
jgi:hypothetical protein